MQRLAMATLALGLVAAAPSGARADMTVCVKNHGAYVAEITLQAQISGHWHARSVATKPVWQESCLTYGTGLNARVIVMAHMVPEFQLKEHVCTQEIRYAPGANITVVATGSLISHGCYRQ